MVAVLAERAVGPAVVSAAVAALRGVLDRFDAALVSGADAAEVARPNIVVILPDDFGYGDVSAYGGPAPTPNLDRLAAQGTRFSNAFAAVSSCSPSRSVILTGLYNHTNGQYGLAHAVNNQVTQRWVESLPKLLNTAGYRTAIIGKNHVQPKEVYPYEIAVEGPTVNRNVKNLARRAREIVYKSAHQPQR